MFDVFGDINVDGTGQPWEYLDGWAYRNDNTGPDGTTFNIFNWSFSGINALDGETTNASAATPFPIGTFTTNFPVELTSFRASIMGNAVKLDWNTATEINNYGFEIERSNENSSWTKIGFVEGTGNSNSPHDYSFKDNTAASGKYSYRLKQIDNDGKFEFSPLVEITLGAPSEFILEQNYPNPFNPATAISFSLPQDGKVKLTVFNNLGEVIETLVNRNLPAGFHTFNFNASSLSSGVYFYKLEAVDFLSVKKMMLLK